MKVTIVNSYYPPWRGGAETYVYNLAHALGPLGHEVTVLCADAPRGAGVYHENSVTVKRLPIRTRVYGTPILGGLREALIEVEADIVHGNFPSPYIAMQVARHSRSMKLPAVLTWHNDLPPVALGARLLIQIHDHLILPSYLKDYRLLIATGETYRTKSRILRKFDEKVRVVPNGVDTEQYNPKANPEPRPFKALSTKRPYNPLRWGTNQMALVQGARHSDERDSDIACQMSRCRLLVIGDGSSKPAYVALGEALGVMDLVTFVGDVPNEELPQYYAAANIVAVPSKDMSEGFGLTILEGNASGKPVVASNVGGIPSVVRDNYNGLLVEPNNPSALSAALLLLFENRELAENLGRNGRKVAEEHDWKITAALTERVYSEALN